MTGLEMDQVIVADAADSAQNKSERPSLPFALKDAAVEKAATGTRKAMFPLDEGDVTLLFPEGLSQEALAELGQYLDIFLKKEQRKGAKTPEEKKTDG